MQLAIGTALIAAAVSAPVHAQTTARAAQVITSNRPYLGIGVRDVDSEVAKKLNLKETRGVEITNVEENSPAAKAGIKEGDVVLEYNGQPVEGGEQLSRFVRETPVGRSVKIGVWRSGSLQTISATIEPSKTRQMIIANGGPPFAITTPEIHMPEMRFDNFPGIVTAFQSPRIGVITEPLANQEQFAEFLGVKEGALVKQVTKNSPAEKAGIKAGDVIVKVEDTSVNASGDITRALREHRAKKTVTLTIVRAKKEMPITVTLETPAGPAGTPFRA
jgi:serine protease Do